MADQSNVSPFDIGALGLLGSRILPAAASGFRAAAPYMGKAFGMLSRGGAGMIGGPYGLAAAAAYEGLQPTDANAGEVDQYVRDPSGALIPNPKAPKMVEPSQPGVDSVDSMLPQPVAPQSPAPPAPGSQASGGNIDPWSASSIPGMVPDLKELQDGQSNIPVAAQPTAGRGGSPRGGVRSDAEVSGTAAPGGEGFFSNIGRKLNDNSNMLLMMGAGLAGKRSLGESISGGLSGAAAGGQADITQNMQQSGIRAAYQQLVSNGVDPRVALAAAYNPELYKKLLGQQYPEPKVVPFGRDRWGQPKQGVQIGSQVVPEEAASQPTPVHTFEEALRLPKGVLFSLPNGRTFRVP